MFDLNTSAFCFRVLLFSSFVTRTEFRTGEEMLNLKVNGQQAIHFHMEWNSSWGPREMNSFRVAMNYTWFLMLQMDGTEKTLFVMPSETFLISNSQGSDRIHFLHRRQTFRQHARRLLATLIKKKSKYVSKSLLPQHPTATCFTRLTNPWKQTNHRTTFQQAPRKPHDNRRLLLSPSTNWTLGRLLGRGTTSTSSNPGFLGWLFPNNTILVERKTSRFE